MQTNKENLKTKKKRTTKYKIGVSLLALGLVFLLAGLGYEVVNYPWGYKRAPLDASALPDPKPVKAGYSFFYPEDFSGSATPDTIPSSDSGVPLVRPPTNLYRLGTIKIPRISLSENIFEGANNEILYGVGHVSGTPLPYESGNFVVAGHRNYVWMHPFRHLDKLEIGDIVEVEIQGSEKTQTFLYEIYKEDTVLPDDSWVMQTQEDAEQTITLVTCTPIPSYSHRLIFWGKLIETTKQ